MSEHKIGEQEKMVLVDGKQHMIKYVDDNGHWKDLGILNEDGCLPSEFGVYPEVYEHVLMGINGYMVKAYIQDPHVGKYAWGKTKQEAVDAWNRRA